MSKTYVVLVEFLSLVQCLEDLFGSCFRTLAVILFQIFSFPLNHGVGQNIAMHAAPTARNCLLVISAFPVYLHFPLSKSSPYFSRVRTRRII